MKSRFAKLNFSIVLIPLANFKLESTATEVFVCGFVACHFFNHQTTSSIWFCGSSCSCASRMSRIEFQPIAPQKKVKISNRPRLVGSINIARFHKKTLQSLHATGGNPFRFELSACRLLAIVPLLFKRYRLDASLAIGKTGFFQNSIYWNFFYLVSPVMLIATIRFPASFP